MSLHVAVSGWLLGEPSGANRRLLALLRATSAQLAPHERITVLHGSGFHPPFAAPGLDWLPVDIPAGPTWRRALRERRLLPPLLRELSATLLDHALLPAPRVPCPQLLTIHDLRDADGEGNRHRWLARAVLRASLRRAAAVVVPSQFTASRLRHFAPALRAPLHVLPNAVDLPPAASPTAAAAPPFVLHVGHLERRKQIDLLLRAMAPLPAPCELRLVGADAGAGAALRALAQQLGIAARVQFLGRVDDAGLARLYATAAVTALPSCYEGFGLPALEALAAGGAVLVSDRGALPEVVGPHASVLPPDVPTWTAALAAALQAPPASPQGIAARQAHATARTWHQLGAELLGLWRHHSVARPQMPATRLETASDQG